MEEWQLDFEWLRVQHYVKDHMRRDSLPDMNAVIMLIGVQELGRMQSSFSKEEKQDLMHIGVCRLLENDGYYKFIGRDQDGWPHYDNLMPVEVKGVREQEKYLKEKIIAYFKHFYEEID